MINCCFMSFRRVFDCYTYYREWLCSLIKKSQKYVPFIYYLA